MITFEQLSWSFTDTVPLASGDPKLVQQDLVQNVRKNGKNWNVDNFQKIEEFLSKIKSVKWEYVSETNQKPTTEVSYILSSVKKALVFLTQSQNWKVAQRKFHSVCSEIKNENLA